MAFSTSTMCNCYQYLVPNIFIIAPYPQKRKPVSIKKSLPILPYLKSLETTNLLSVSVLDLSYKWNRTICDFFWFLSLVVFLRFIHMATCISTSLLLIVLIVLWDYMCIPHFVYPFMYISVISTFWLLWIVSP